MSAEWFLKLKEYDSLGKMRIGHLKAIKEQEERLLSLNHKRQEQLDEQDQLKHELLSVQQTYFESEKKMNSCEEQAGRLRDIGGDEEKIKRYKAEAAELENSLFEMLDRIEVIHASMEDKKTFLSGIEKTIKDIETEVAAEVESHKKDISQVEMRLKLIEGELPDDFRSTLERTLKKNLAIGPFTKNENGSCYFCRYKISKLDESEIDMQRVLKLCPQCSRIFLPYGS